MHLKHHWFQLILYMERDLACILKILHVHMFENIIANLNFRIILEGFFLPTAMRRTLFASNGTDVYTVFFKLVSENSHNEFHSKIYVHVRNNFQNEKALHMACSTFAKENSLSLNVKQRHECYVCLSKIRVGPSRLISSNRG